MAGFGKQTQPKVSRGSYEIHCYGDVCEVIITKTVKIDLTHYRLDEAYYADGTLTIKGDKDMSGKPSSATVKLP